MSEITIDYRKLNAKKEIKDALDNWISSDQEEKLKIKIEHVVSGDFEEDFEDDFEMDDVTDFNGWQCDWWNSMEYKGYTFALYGGAWYGTIEITSK